MILVRRMSPNFWKTASAVAAVLAVVFAAAVWFARPVSVVSASAKSTPRAIVSNGNPDAVCANCHRDIYESYERTPMARDSGDAVAGLIQGGFLHAASGVRYRIFLRDGRAWMSYDRDGGQAPLHGERQLSYFIGSGHRGRTYLYQVDGEWFEIPINYYGKKQLWDMAPNYGKAETMPDALPVDSNCLHCHSTDVQMALPGARNRYAGQPFLRGGVGCSSCHGDTSRHLAAHGYAPILDPAKLDPAHRDSVCLQCHLEGDVAIYRAGRSLARFRPGDELSDDVVYFVKASEATGGGRASSQYEALLRSACKIASGNKLTCTTCHDPHYSPSAEERVEYFRSKCLTCHTGTAMATKHHPEQRDCAVCHMPTRETTDISHEQKTDHNIQRYPASVPEQAARPASIDLVPVGHVQAGDREMGLAYAELAERGSQAAGEKALPLLRRAEKSGADDAELHTQLGFLDQVSGDIADAQKEYADAIRQDPHNASAAGDMAILDLRSGKAAEAVSLFERVIEADPSQMAAGMDLAFIECRLDNKSGARQILQNLLRLNPDDPELRQFLATGRYRGGQCSVMQPSQ